MFKYISNIYLFFLLISFNIIFSNKYPIYHNISNSECGNIKTILIKSKENYLDFVLQKNYVISLTEYTIYEKEPKIISVFDKASSYKILKDWNFLRIQCYEKNDLCDLLSKDVTNKTLPSIRIYVKSQEIKTSKIMLEFDISDFLEYLLKLSSNPTIEIKNNDINNFYKNYGTFSPLIYYNPKNTEFISCINLLAKKKYYKFFYFGINSIDISGQNFKKEKIIFDFDNMPISMTWDRDCDDVDKFLEQNKYPLLTKIEINNEFINNLIVDEKILVILIAMTSTYDKIIQFINNEYKKIAYTNRELVFGYCFYDEFDANNYIMNKTNFKFFSKEVNSMRLMLYNFSDDSYYIYPLYFKLNSTNVENIFNRMNNIISSYNELPFYNGSIFDYIWKKSIFYKFLKDKKKLIALFFTIIFIILGCLYLCFYSNCQF